jgi:hypothetical protein
MVVAGTNLSSTRPEQPTEEMLAYHRGALVGSPA